MVDNLSYVRIHQLTLDDGRGAISKVSWYWSH